MSNIDIFQYELGDMPKLRRDLMKLPTKRLLALYKARRGGLISMDGSYYDECDGADPWAEAVLNTFKSVLDCHGHIERTSARSEQPNTRKLKFKLQKVVKPKPWNCHDYERLKKQVLEDHVKRFGR